MKTTGRRLERLHKRTGLTVHCLAFEEHVRSYKEELSRTKIKYYSTLIHSQQDHPRTLFFTINRLLHPPADSPTPEDPDRCSKFLEFFSAKVDSIHQQLLLPAPLRCVSPMGLRAPTASPPPSPPAVLSLSFFSG